VALKYGVCLPQGWTMDLVGITDPVQAFETMTCVAQTAETCGYESVWLLDHFHTVPSPRRQ
jgi:alkanesulfonate monooxygenase SsuD/methylene tetrahydromethanopterin reductase-like flavin-dependent oxidoreductase (luciferase family)